MTRSFDTKKKKEKMELGRSVELSAINMLLTLLRNNIVIQRKSCNKLYYIHVDTSVLLENSPS